MGIAHVCACVTEAGTRTGAACTSWRDYIQEKGYLFLIKQVRKGSEESEKRRHPEMIEYAGKNKRKFLRSQRPSTCNPAAQDSGVILDKQDETQTKQQYALTRHRTKHKGKERLKVQERGRNIQQPEPSRGVLSIPDNRFETGDVVRERQVSV